MQRIETMVGFNSLTLSHSATNIQLAICLQRWVRQWVPNGALDLPSGLRNGLDALDDAVPPKGHLRILNPMRLASSEGDQL